MSRLEPNPSAVVAVCVSGLGGVYDVDTDESVWLKGLENIRGAGLLDPR